MGQTLSANELHHEIGFDIIDRSNVYRYDQLLTSNQWKNLNFKNYTRTHNSNFQGYPNQALEMLEKILESTSDHKPIGQPKFGFDFAD